MSRTCPSCGATDYGTPFCVSCQQPLPKAQDVLPDADGIPSLLENVSAHAGFFRRLIAIVIDWFLLSLIADLVRFVYTFGSRTDPGFVDMAMGFSILIFFLYFTLLTGESGQTLGKMLLGIKVVGAEGEPISYTRALVRTIGYIPSSFFFCLGFLWSIWDRKHQTWHDKIAGTIVVKV